MKFRNKPKGIEAEQFWPEKLPWLPNVGEYDGSGGYYVFNQLHQSHINIKPGDWIRTDNPKDYYPIKQEYMNQNYEQIGEQT